MDYGIEEYYGLNKDKTACVDSFVILKGSRIRVYGRFDDMHAAEDYPLTIELLEDCDAECLENEVPVKCIDFKKTTQKHLAAYKKYRQNNNKGARTKLVKQIENLQQQLKNLDAGKDELGDDYT